MLQCEPRRWKIEEDGVSLDKLITVLHASEAIFANIAMGDLYDAVESMVFDFRFQLFHPLFMELVAPYFAPSVSAS